MTEQKFLINEEVIFFDENRLIFRRAFVREAQLIDHSEKGEQKQYIRYTLQSDTKTPLSVPDEYVFREAKDIARFLGIQLQHISNYDFSGDEETGSISFEIKEEYKTGNDL